MTILGFMVRKLLGKIGIQLSGSAILSTDKGRLLIIAAASHRNVWRHSASSWDLTVLNNAAMTLLTESICLSHMPPAWLADGTLNLNSQASFIKWALTLLLSMPSSSCLISRSAPKQFVPQSEWRTLTLPLIETNLL